MRKVQVDTFKSLLQMKNLRHGPLLQYNGDPEGVVEAKPGTMCCNLNYGTDGILYYQKTLGHGKYGWSPLYGGSPRVMTTHIDGPISADADKIVFTAPENLVVRKVVISCEVNVDAAATSTWGFNLKNYGALISHTNLGAEMLAADVVVNTPWSQYVELEVVPDQNRFVRDGSVIELLIDETDTGGAPTQLTNVNFTVFYWPGCGRSESISANLGDVPIDITADEHYFLCRAPKAGYVDGVRITASVDANSGAADHYTIQVTNLHDDGAGSENLCSTAHNTNTDADIYGYNVDDNGGDPVNRPCDLVIDQNRFVMEGDILMMTLIGEEDGSLQPLDDCVVTVDLTLFDSEDVRAVQGTLTGDLGQITVPHDSYERFILFTAPFDCRARNCFVISDAAMALDATDYVEAYVWRFKKMNYENLQLDGRDPSPDLMNSVVVTTQLGEPGAEAIDADVPWPSTSGVELIDQNRNLKKGDVVKIEFYAWDGTGTTSEVIGTNHTAVIFEIDEWDPDQVGLTANIGH